jgi:hypothetical protein
LNWILTHPTTGIETVKLAALVANATAVWNDVAWTNSNWLSAMEKMIPWQQQQKEMSAKAISIDGD